MTSLQDAVDELYRITVVEAKRTSTSRLQSLGDYCVEQLEGRGLRGAEKEARIPGAGREKQWDVALRYGDKFRVGLSL